MFDKDIIRLISRANNALGAYRGFLVNTINPMLLISPLVSQEAVLSSKLEGTHATIDDFINEEGRHKLPLCTRLIKEMHKILLDNVRGQTKTPGEFKTEQNYIGSASAISFTPLPPELTNEYMGNLEQYIHYDEVDLLVQAALIHCQFEMIHPFKDAELKIEMQVRNPFQYLCKSKCHISVLSAFRLTKPGLCLACTY